MVSSKVYIDESGDLGFNRGTTWFVLSAVIVDDSAEAHIRSTIQRLKTALNINELHLRKIGDFNRRAFIARTITGEEFTYINVIVDTTKLTLGKEKSNSIAYNFICRLLLERVSWFLRDTDRVADIILSSRASSKDNELIQYIRNTLLTDSTNQIASRTINKVKAMPSGSWDLLQLADICATTTFWAYQIGQWGYRMPCFYHILKRHIYTYKGKAIGYGIKYFSSDMVPNEEDLKDYWPCKTN